MQKKKKSKKQKAKSKTQKANSGSIKQKVKKKENSPHQMQADVSTSDLAESISNKAEMDLVLSSNDRVGSKSAADTTTTTTTATTSTTTSSSKKTSSSSPNQNGQDPENFSSSSKSKEPEILTPLEPVSIESDNHKTTEKPTSSSKHAVQNTSHLKQNTSQPKQKTSRRRAKDNNNPWIFSESTVISKSPSIAQFKMTLPQELRLKESIHDFVIKLGRKLDVNAPTILATSIYLHRYYMRQPITTSKYIVASAALTIAGKLNDCIRPPDKISLYACNLKNPKAAKYPLPGSGSSYQPPPIDESSEIFWNWRDQLLYREELILRKLAFDLNFPSPYLFQFKILNKVHAGMGQLLYDNIRDILRMAIKLVELLSSLPTILCYDMMELFATSFVIIILEGKTSNPALKDLKIPVEFFDEILEVDLEQVLKCFRFLKYLLQASQDDPKCVSNRNAAKRILRIKSALFEEVARGG